MFDPGKKRAPSNERRLERARGDLEEGRAGEGNFGKMLSSPESCYTMWPPFTMQAQVAPFLLPTLRPAEKASGACVSIPGPLHPVSRRLQETKDLLQPDFNKGPVVIPL